MTSILSKLLEKLIQIRIKGKIGNYFSPFQAGSRQNRSTADNLFLIRIIIDHILYQCEGKYAGVKVVRNKKSKFFLIVI